MSRLGQLRTVEPWERIEGNPSPIGTTWIESERAWNFSLFSRHATGATLLLYGDDPKNPVHRFELDPVQNKSGTICHCMVPEALAPGAKYYAWNIDGPSDPARGQRFDAEKVLLDPFAPAVHF